jgi:hypothetical protein
MADDRESSGAEKVSTILLCCVFIVNLILLLAFLAFVAVVCAAVIPILYGIDDGTDHIKHVEDGTDHIPAVEDGIYVLHEDLTTVIGQLNVAAGVLLSIDSNIVNLCNGHSCSAYGSAQ